jgi:hypothetical protein
MNCANHPDVAVAAYCQSCGKPLCTACIRSVGGVIYCEPCLAARLSPGSSSGSFGGNLFTDPNNLHAHPMLAGLLGFIPGVGAMYNGQFVKALASSPPGSFTRSLMPPKRPRRGATGYPCPIPSA